MTSPTPNRVLVLRHAHAPAARPGEDDHDRPLDAAGLEQARRLARFLSQRQIGVDGVVVSTARRAIETLDAIREALELQGSFAVSRSEALYRDGLDAYHEAARSAEGRSVLIVGHNPTIQAFAQALCRPDDEVAAQALGRGFPTCGLAVVDLAADPAEACGRLVAFFDPRKPDADGDGATP